VEVWVWSLTKLKKKDNKPSAEQELHSAWVYDRAFKRNVKFPTLYALHVLLYIELTISFLIGPKCTVNSRNQCLGHYLAADYTIIMSRTLKVMDKHVMYDCGA